jgi:hypothetical protein
MDGPVQARARNLGELLASFFYWHRQSVNVRRLMSKRRGYQWEIEQASAAT